MSDIDMADSTALWSANPYPAPAGSIWDSVGNTFGKLVDVLGTAGLTRAAYEINKPVYDAAGKTKSPDGLLGKIGTVGISIGADETARNFVILIAIAVAVYFLAKKGR